MGCTTQYTSSFPKTLLLTFQKDKNETGREWGVAVISLNENTTMSHFSWKLYLFLLKSSLLLFLLKRVNISFFTSQSSFLSYNLIIFNYTLQYSRSHLTLFSRIQIIFFIKKSWPFVKIQVQNSLIYLIFLIIVGKKTRGIRLLWK